MSHHDFDAHPEDDAFRDFLTDVDRILSRAIVALALLAALGLGSWAAASV